MTENTKEVQTSIGVFTLKKPKAGIRNKALIKAETDTGAIKTTVLMTELLPHCVQRRPEGCDKDTPIDHILDELEMEDYDNLFQALASMIDLQESKKKTIMN